MNQSYQIMLHIQEELKLRANHLESLEKQGQIPGCMDRFELERLRGRIKELKFLLKQIKIGKLELPED